MQITLKFFISHAASGCRTDCSQPLLRAESMKKFSDVCMHCIHVGENFYIILALVHARSDATNVWNFMVNSLSFQ